MENGLSLLAILEWALWALSLSLIAGALAPFIRSGEWWLRVWDFPRMQLGTVSLAAAGAFLILGLAGRAGPVNVTFGVLVTLAGLWQFHYVVRYSRLWPKTVESTNEPPQLRLLTANLDKDNQRKSEVVARLAEANVDMMLLIEVDAGWRAALAPIRDSFEHHLEEVAPDGLGLVLWSSVPLRAGVIKHLLSKRRPSIHATIELLNGRAVQFVGIHPTPPALPTPDGEERYDSRIRDAELVRVGRETASRSDEPWIVAGDFNDVAWSHTTKLFEDVSGLCDPRVGRRLLNTYHAERPLLRYPLDHVYLSPGFKIRSIERRRTPGSDHFGVYIELTLPEILEQRPDADAEEQKEAREVEQSGREDARERHEATPDV